MYHPRLCASGDHYGQLPLYSPWGVEPWFTDYDTALACRLIIVSMVFTALYSLVLTVWFGWTLWLATKVTKTMGEPWTRDLVIKKVSMGKMSKLHQWREGENIRLDKVNSA